MGYVQMNYHKKWYHNKIQYYGWKVKLWLWLFAESKSAFDCEAKVIIHYYEYKDVIYIRAVQIL